MNSYAPTAHIRSDFLRSHREGDVASVNERGVLDAIFLQRKSSRSELAQSLGLTQQSIHRICEQLVEREMIKLGPPRASSGRGKPSPVPILNGDYAFNIGLSINTDEVGVCVMTFDGTHHTQPVAIGGLTRDAALDRIDETIGGMIPSLGLDRERLFGLGCGIAGYAVGGTKFNAPTPLHEWSLIELGPLLHDRFDVPAWVDNGANTAALCEAMFGVGRHTGDFVYMSFNYGFGGALVLNGELWRGKHGNAGELSGGFNEEQTKRRPALNLLIAKLAENGISVSSVQDLRQRFDPDWPGVEDWIQDVLPAHNMLLSMLVSIVDPALIVYGGEIPPKLATMFIEHTELVVSNRYGVPREVAKQVVSPIAKHASSIGAAALPFKSCFF